MIKRAKIVATIGPAGDPPQVLADLIRSGVNIFRINLAHGDMETHTRRVQAIRAASKQLGLPVGILADLAGPKLRLGKILNDSVNLTTGENLVLARGATTDQPSTIVTEYPYLLDELKKGDMIVIGDGGVSLVVEEVSPERAICKVVDEGTIRSRQGIALPNTRLRIETLSEQDYEHARWASEQKLDFVSISFVRTPEDITGLRAFLTKCNSQAAIIAKIEKRESLNCLEEIVEASDGVMVARGDLGLEVDIATTAVVQKRIVQTCMKHHKPVIVATQMLESMHTTKRPTRAEVADVTNAVLDGADACMLSGETAVGKYPVDSVRMMARIQSEAERLLQMNPGLGAWNYFDESDDVTQAVVQGASQIAKLIRAKLIVVASQNGRAATLMAKLRTMIPTVYVTDSEEHEGHATLWWGVDPMLVDSIESEGLLIEAIHRWNSQKKYLEKGDRIILLTDVRSFPSGHDSILVYEFNGEEIQLQKTQL